MKWVGSAPVSSRHLFGIQSPSPSISVLFPISYGFSLVSERWLWISPQCSLQKVVSVRLGFDGNYSRAMARQDSLHKLFKSLFSFMFKGCSSEKQAILTPVLLLKQMSVLSE